jgi:hypothetical protein
VWGQEYEKVVTIPKVIDDYNHWLGVDRSDQLISYYRPDLRCRRTWIPLFLQGLMIVQVNAFIVFKQLKNAPKTSHKDFLLQFVFALMQRVREAKFTGIAAGRVAVANEDPAATKKKKKENVNGSTYAPHEEI